MNANEHIAVEDLALFALLLLGEEDAAQVRAHLAECALCTEELRLVREDLARYALAVEPVAPPKGARDRFLASVARTGQQPAARPELQKTPGPVAVPVPSFGQVHDEAERPRRSGVARVLAFTSLTGWIAAAAAIVIAVGLRQDRDSLRAALQSQHAEVARYEASEARARQILGALTDPSAVRVTLTTPKAPTAPSARATYQQKSGTLLLQASNLAPLRPQKIYELWLIPSNGGAPIAVSTFQPDAHGNANVLVPSLAGATAVKAFGITEEPEGGSTTPTMPILLAGSPA